jgi:transcriptional regulator with XRE-family HTH domain
MSNLKELREKKGLTQSQLAELAGTSQPQIRRLENGDRELTVAWAERLAGPLNTTPVGILFPHLQTDRTQTPTEQLRAALIAYGVDREDLGPILRVINGFVNSDADDDEQPRSDRSPSARASRRHEPTP